MNIFAPIRTPERLKAVANLTASGQYEAAREQVEAILQDDPDHPDALNAYATLLIKAGKLEEAHRILGTACTRYPDHDQLVANLAAAHFLLQAYDEALACIEHAIALAPQTEAYQVTKAQIYLSKGESNEALAIAEALIKRDPAMASTWTVLAAAYRLRGDLRAAEQAYLKALKIDPEDADTLVNLSRLLLKQSRFDEALTLAERAVLAAPTELPRKLHLVQALRLGGHAKRAETLARRVLAIAPQNLEALQELALSLALQGKADEGVKLLSSGIRSDPKNTAAIASLVFLLQKCGRLEQALTFNEQILALKPDDPKALILQSELILGLGRIDQAKPAVAASQNWPAEIYAPEAMGAVQALLLGRYLPLLADKGGTLNVDPDAGPVSALLGCVEGARIGKVTPAQADAEQLAGLLPRLLGETGIQAEAIPYLAAPPASVERWRKALASHRRPCIGVVWDGEPYGASAALLAEITESLPATIVSLAIGRERDALAAWPTALDAGAHFNGPLDVLAAVSCLDVVVAVDTLPLHCAGALGLPAVAVLPCNPAWCWAADADGRSLWYPSVRVVRQGSLHRWDDVAAGARRQLEDILGSCDATTRVH